MPEPPAGPSWRTRLGALWRSHNLDRVAILVLALLLMALAYYCR